MPKVIKPTKGLVFINDNGVIKQFPLPATEELLGNPKVQYFIQQGLLEIVEKKEDSVKHSQTKVQQESKPKKRPGRPPKQNKKG